MNVSCKYISLFCFLFLGACATPLLKKNSSASAQRNLPTPSQSSQDEKIVIDNPVVYNLDQAPTSLQKLKNSVVRLKISGSASSLTENSSDDFISTAFFYKTSELLVTSLHTFPARHECLVQKKCTITIGFIQDAKTLLEKQLTASVALIETDKDLIYLHVSNSKEYMDITPLVDSDNQSQKTLSVSGFFEDNPAITFTSGKKINHKTTKNLTSLIVSSGFSGSPILDEEGKVVGVVSSFMPIKNHRIGFAQYVSLNSL